MEGVIPRVGRVMERLSTRHIPFSEQSATIVWETLYKLGVAEETILWNAVQLHPHKDHVWTNRTPSDQELARGAPALKILLSAYRGARIVAVGKKAEKVLNDMGIIYQAGIRHPANGGAKEFGRGLEQVLAG
jgi:hypothetical protein